MLASGSRVRRGFGWAIAREALLGDALLGELGAAELGHDASVAEHQHAVAEVGEVARSRRSRRSRRIPRSAASAISRRSAPRADVDALGRLVQEQDLRARSANHLARSTFCWLPPLTACDEDRLGVGRPDVEPLQQIQRARVLAAGGSTALGSELADRQQRDVVGHGRFSSAAVACRLAGTSASPASIARAGVERRSSCATPSPGASRLGALARPEQQVTAPPRGRMPSEAGEAERSRRRARSNDEALDDAAGEVLDR